MIGLAVTFDLGRYHANPWGTHVNDGAVEWPPSPWRILRGLYSAARTHAGLGTRQQAVDQALDALVRSGPPRYEIPPSVPAHTRHWMPGRTWASHSPHKDIDKVIDAFHAVDPSSELRVWWDLDLDAEATDALASTARVLGYLGRSESVCTCRLLAGAGPDQVSAEPRASAFDSDGEPVELLCPDPLAGVDSLARSVLESRRERLLVPSGAGFVSYLVRAPRATGRAGAPKRVDTRPSLALFRLGGKDRPALFEAVAVGQTLRRRLLGRFGKLTDGASSATFSGKAGDRPRDDQHRHAHYLALPDPGDRRVGRLVVWAPEGFGPREVEALAGLDRMRLRGTGDLPLVLATLGNPGEMDLPGLLGPAERWRSLTPFALPRHPKRRRGELVDAPEEQARRELAQRGLDPVAEAVLESGSWHSFRSSRASRLDRTHAGLVGLRLRFNDPIRGPLVLGALSHFGLGVLVPEG